MRIVSVRLHVVMLTVVTVSNGIGISPSTKIKFPMKVIQPDLEAISKYYQNIRKDITAYIHWPDAVIFRVQLKPEKSTEYLKIGGTFYLKRFKIISHSYNGLYYENGKFYVKNEQEDSLHQISPNKAVYFVRSRVKQAKPYLSIRYFGLEDMQEKIEKHYSKHENHFDTVLFKYPATFLVRVPNPDGHFVEYTYWGKDNLATLADGNLRVLIGKNILNKKRLKDNKEAYRLVFDQRKHTLGVPDNPNINSEPLRHVFGVRMANTGFLAEVLESGIRLLSSEELNRGIINRSISLKDILRKMKIVEPRYRYRELDLPTPAWPKRVKFQIKGQVLVKGVCYRSESEIDYDHPFFIESETKGATVTMGDSTVVRLYTNDDQLLFLKSDN